MSTLPSWMGVPQDLPLAITQMRDHLSRIELLLKTLIEVQSTSNEPAAPPDLVDLGPGLVQSTHVRYRTVGLIFTGGTATDAFAFKVGSRTLLALYPPQSGFIPFVQTIDRGVQLQVVDLTTPAANNWQAYLVAGVE